MGMRVLTSTKNWVETTETAEDAVAQGANAELNVYTNYSGSEWVITGS